MSEKSGSRSEVVANLVRSSLSQARKSCATYVDMCERMRVTAEVDSDFARKALEFAKQDADANIEFALKLLDATTLDDVIALQDAHAARQTGEMARRETELQSLAAGVSAAVVPATADNSGECIAGAAAAAAVLAGGAAAAAPLQTGELDSAAIAAELEQSAGRAADATADVEIVVAGQDGGMDAEIAALAARIHEAKAGSMPGRDISDEDIAAAVAAAELEDVPVPVEAEQGVQGAAEDVAEAAVADAEDAEVAELAAELENALLADDEEYEAEEAAVELEQALLASDEDLASPTVTAEGDGDAEAGAQADAEVELDVEDDATDVEELAAEFEQALLADDDDFEAEEAAAELEQALLVTDQEIAAVVAPAADAAVPEPAAVAAPSAVAESSPAAKSFSLDLAAQLDAVRALIRGGKVATDERKVPEPANR